MPGRRDTFRPNGIYHVFNRTIDRKSIFHQGQLAQNLLDTLLYYRSQKARISFSQYRHLKPHIKLDLETQISLKKFFKIRILSYCLMPTHFHLIIQQLTPNGLVDFMSDTINSFTRSYNIRNNRNGPLFLPRFTIT